ncbi:hypothetical protein CHS0354_025436 [Potamilus streckersoni]|uniref:Beta-glucuronidase n=1 Tax=Potamilus streckersoni TaxID=2493646 RepID=A0AAE0VYX0_9BIVA|nr:hypothetical protein CHS0354_025436 [Potamilus streckersoni]
MYARVKFLHINMNSFQALAIYVMVALVPTSAVLDRGMLYPRSSESRSLFNLDGMWNFRVDASPSRNDSFDKKWYLQPLDKTGSVIPMPVPSSYNDITQDKSIRDFVGWAWYDRQFYTPATWNSQRIVLRFGSAHYYTIVWVNYQEVMRHDGGHLPFEAEVNSYLYFDRVNRVTVAVNNTLTSTTLPPGSITYKADPNMYPPGYFVQDLQMDFFNYAGIHRHVTLYSTPRVYVDDITIVTDIFKENGIVNYTIKTGGPSDQISLKVEVVDKDEKVVASSTKNQSSLIVHNARYWWPYTMNPKMPGYMYTLRVTLVSVNGTDVYRQPFGIRTVRVLGSKLLINQDPFYCLGVNKHEDFDIRGKGLDYALIAKDFNLMKWLGANCFRTSHYPYAEELMDQADQQGIVVIDESPGVGIGKISKAATKYYKLGKLKCSKRSMENVYFQECQKHQPNKRRIKEQVKNRKKKVKKKMKSEFFKRDENFGNVSLAHHLEVMEELVRRDKNRPSVIIWSVANEPATNKPIAEPYFKTVLNHVRSLDLSRPVTFVCNQNFNNDVAIPYVDIILVNRYYGWYSDTGHTELIQRQLEYDFRQWHQKYAKPMILSEYGADTVPGIHRDPSFVFSEEYQVEFLQEYHQALDTMRRDFVVGEMVWNFADFMTAQGITRVLGNRKGIFTRDRQPKMSAHVLRSRYLNIANNTHYSNFEGTLYFVP